MACIVKQKRKGTDTVYVYRSESVWIPNVGPRSKRTLIGKLDPATGQIVPTGKRGRKKKEPEQPEPEASAAAEPVAADVPGEDLERIKQALMDTLAQEQQLKETMDALEQENALLREELAQMKALMGRMEQCLQDMKAAVQNSFDLCLNAFQTENTETEG